MLYFGRVYVCDRRGEQSIQEARTTEGVQSAVMMVTVPEWLHGWEVQEGRLLCPGCNRLWESTRQNFFRRVAKTKKEEDHVS